jgi:Cu/Ag efflux pump CusA
LVYEPLWHFSKPECHLGGLAIAIGIMVDGSVVVVENTFAKLGERLKSRRIKKPDYFGSRS